MSGRFLACGCLAGMYRTWDRDIVTIIDGRGVACDHAQHADHVVLSRIGSAGTTDLIESAAPRERCES